MAPVLASLNPYGAAELSTYRTAVVADRTSLSSIHYRVKKRTEVQAVGKGAVGSSSKDENYMTEHLDSWELGQDKCHRSMILPLIRYTPASSGGGVDRGTGGAKCFLQYLSALETINFSPRPSSTYFRLAASGSVLELTNFLGRQ